MNYCKYGCGQEGKYQLKNGNWICSENHSSCPVLRKKNSDSGRTYKFKKCKYCDKKYKYLKQHEPKCYLNPKNLKLCPVCNYPIKDYKHAKTCSNKCANGLFKQAGENHWNYNKDKRHYREICFTYHEQKCIICGEDIAVDVHHYDENHNNNHPTNLIPLCPTHHIYVRMSEAYYIIKECIDDYYSNFKNIWGGGQTGKASALHAEN